MPADRTPLAAESLARVVTALRLALKAKGYLPVPVYGKRALMKDWRQACRTADAAAIMRWPVSHPDCISTGFLCGELVGVDIDVPLPETVAALEAEIYLTLGMTPLRRVGNAPKVMLCYRTDAPFTKISTGNYYLPGATADTPLKQRTKLCVEFLGDGQQFVAAGIHPDTGRRYEWTRGRPDRIGLAELPTISQADVLALRDRLRALLVAAGGEPPPRSVIAPGSPLALDVAPSSARLGLVAEALGWLDNAERDYDGWIKIGHAIYSETGEAGRELWQAWSARSPKYDPEFTDSRWPTFSGVRNVTIRTVWAEAEAAGWTGHPDRGLAAAAAYFAPLSPEQIEEGRPAALAREAREAAAIALEGTSEEALALRFADLHSGDLRFVAEYGKWLHWDGRVWRVDSTRLALDLVRAVCREAADALPGRVPGGLLSAKTAAAVERLASCDRRIARSSEDWDRDPWLLNTPGGVVDLRTGDVLPHDSALMMTKITGVASAHGATPVFDRFLNRVCGGDADLVTFLQRMAGYALTGDTREHSLFFLWGSGANGKSVFLGVLAGILGDYATTAPVETFTASAHDRHPTEIARLKGARLVTASETEEDRRWDESKVKALTGGDRIAARHMRQDFFEFTPEFKLVIAGNHKPGLRGVDEAIGRRMKLVPFTVTIPAAERDDDLATKLRAEWPAILAWMVRGCLGWQADGLAVPEAVTAATAKYLSAEDVMGQWIADRCTLDTKQATSSADLFNDWRQYANASGEKEGSRKRFSQKFENRTGIPSSRTRVGAVFNGVGLKPPGDFTALGGGANTVEDILRSNVLPFPGKDD